MTSKDLLKELLKIIDFELYEEYMAGKCPEKPEADLLDLIERFADEVKQLESLPSPH